MKVNHITPINILDYPYHQKLKDDLLPLLKYHHFKDLGHTNVKATHTEWDWQKDHTQVKKIKLWVLNEAKKNSHHAAIDEKQASELRVVNFWANVYNKGDYANMHTHIPSYISFSYFLKSKWYYPSLVFTDSMKKVRPKEGRVVIFPSYLRHHVSKHKFTPQRITLSGNIAIVKQWSNAR